eukprot:c3130_g1_i1.p1 GENE.c3130_g1_i1~~c3130_g1_i1.p1  ORF type:complete len:162 (-),score=43.78 c3130_g1_i1:137-622(-)
MSTVPLLVDKLALTATFAATAALYLKAIPTYFIQGGKKAAAGTRAPEDTPTFKKQQNFNAVPTDDKSKKKHQDAERWNRIVQNDIENIPTGLIVAWGALLVTDHPQTHAVLVSAFAAFRIFHTLAYANQLQPHRALAWFGGVLSVLGLLGTGALGLANKWK